MPVGVLPGVGAAIPAMMPGSHLIVSGLPGHSGHGSAMPAAAIELPNRVLYLQNLPLAMPEDGGKERSLQAIFQRYPGFQEVRLVAARPDVAFVEYETEVQASAARQGTDQLEFGGSIIRVSFARR